VAPGAVHERVPLGALLRIPGMAPLFAASMVGRLPLGAIGLLALLRTHELTGSYAIGGVVAGTYALANGIAAPFIGRMVDRRGQGPVLVPAAAIGALALCAFALLREGAPVTALIACAAVAGAAHPPLGPCLRTLWPRLLGDDPARLHTAFALESAAIEATYIAGPVLIAGAIGSQSLAAAVFTCAALQLAGTAAFAAHPASREWRSPGAAGSDLAGALRAPGVRTLMLVFALVGATFGAVEVGVPVAAEAAGSKGLAGLLLGVWGTGSLIGGIVLAHTAPPADPPRRLAIMLAALAAGHLTLVAASGTLMLAALLLVAGLAIAPSVATTFGLVEGVAPRGTVTEAYTWLATGISAGLALGAALAGYLSEHVAENAGFVAAAAACAGAAAVGALRRRTLVPSAAAAEPII
jgi:predicted MFS family arabinose efflux permease